MSERRGTKALELWCRRMTEGYPGVKVDNMTTSWRDGLAFCAMIHHFRPDLIEFDKLTKSDVYYNNALAFTTAEKYLGIPALLDADDMAAYEVPDRLSILTYLSQFYQVFAAQDAHNRLKRPSSSTNTDKTQITKPAGPPSKMAHVVGVPRRDPCRKCQLPVFLAERLTVGKKVYHRTCLKCARCGSQLTPGSFYETEIDDQYCCETCPDEEIATATGMAAAGEMSPVAAAAGNSFDSLESESFNVQLRNSQFERDNVLRSPQSSSNFASSSHSAVRSSIKDRLAFFEQQQQRKEGGLEGGLLPATAVAVDSKLLQKSLSDEEKTKSLQKGESLEMENHTVYKKNSALSSFMYDTVDNEPVQQGEDEADEDEDESVSLASSHLNRKMYSSDSEETDEVTTSSTPAPELPKTLPPMEEQKEELKEIKADNNTTKRFTSSAQLVLGTTTVLAEEQAVLADDQRNVVGTSRSPEKLISDPAISSTSYDKTNNNLHDDDGSVISFSPVHKQHQQQQQEHDDNDDVVEVTEAPRRQMTTIQTIQHLELENNLACNKTNDNDCVTKDKATEEVSMDMDADTVAAQQLEVSTTYGDEPLNHENNVVVVTKSIESMAEEEEEEDHKLDTSDSNVTLRTKTSEAEISHPPATVGDDVETTQRLSVVRARLQQFEVITNNETEKDSNKDYTTTTTAINDNHQNEKEVEAEVAEICKESSQYLPNTIPVNVIETKSRLDVDNENENENENSLKSTIQIQQELEIGTQKEKDLIENLEQEIKETAIEISSIAVENENDTEVPLEKMETIDDKPLENKNEINDEMKIEQQEEETKEDLQHPLFEKSPSKTQLEEYPEELNPFASDDDDNGNEEDEGNKENVVQLRSKPPIPPQPSPKIISVNPFDSSDDEIELEKSLSARVSTASTPKIPPPRPPPPRISRNPFGSEDEQEGGSFARRSSLTASQGKARTPVPTPRGNVSQSQNPTPEPTPRLSTKSNSFQQQQQQQQHLHLHHHHQHHQHTGNSNSATTTPQSNSYVLQNSSDFYGSANSLHSNNAQTPNNLLRHSDIRSSNNSLNLSAGGTIRSRKSRRAPLPPAPVKELFPSSETVNSSSKASTPSSSTVGTPKSGRKKRPAPAPPKPARLDSATTVAPTMSTIPQIQIDPTSPHIIATTTTTTTLSQQPKNLLNYPLQSELDSKLSDEEKALLEGKTSQSTLQPNPSVLTLSPAMHPRTSSRIIPLDKDLLEEHLFSQCDDLKQQQNLQKSYNLQQEPEEANVVYRRILIPHIVDTPTHESNPLLDELNKKSPTVGERQLEKLKDNKEANNRNRQSQISAASSGAEDNDPLFNKSVHGKWKRRKGPAPALPIPPRKVLQMLPLQEIKHELEIIEVQQQGLEKQGVVLEKMIRDRCENQNGEPLSMNSGGGSDGATATGGNAGDTSATDGSSSPVENSKEVEYLILQLFELVNEKNELFRRQAELMYLRRQHRLEQEQADLEYEIRVLMAQPERNKTDSDKAREEALIERLVEVVQLRNEVVECLEMDRIREAEEDQSIKQRLESHIAQREEQPETKTKSSTLSKLSKKEKKKQKEAKKMGKSKKLDADKDADESECSVDKQKTKRKKKLLIF